MKRIRNQRRRSAALALAPVIAATTIAGLSSIGPAAAADSPATALKANHNRVGAGERVTLQGHFRTAANAASPTAAATTSSGGADRSQIVRIQFRAIGASNWHDARRTKTGRSGRFSERVGVSRSGFFRALSADGRKTAPEKIRVKSETQARLSNESPNVGDRIAIRGHVAPAGSRRKVAVTIGGETVHTKTATDGHFETEWKATEAGTNSVSVRASSDPIAAGSSDRAGEVTVFRPAEASYYGPGLYGNGVACGGTLTPTTIGVANKTLPCGTKLTIRYGNREVETKVIDRGPYVAGREFDLTEALRNKLGFGGVGTILVSK